MKKHHKAAISHSLASGFFLFIPSGLDFMLVRVLWNVVIDHGVFHLHHAHNVFVYSYGAPFCPLVLSPSLPQSELQPFLVPDFVGEDCSQSLKESPELFHLAKDGLCDVRKYGCRIARAVGKGFIETEKLTCLFKELKVGKMIYCLFDVSFIGLQLFAI